MTVVIMASLKIKIIQVRKGLRDHIPSQGAVKLRAAKMLGKKLKS